MRLKLKKALKLIAIIMLGIFLVAAVVAFARQESTQVLAAGPLPPPAGYPKLTLSTKVVNPALAGTNGAVLGYEITIRNTGAAAATGVTLVDAIPAHTAFKSVTAPAILDNGVIKWNGTVGFDTSVLIKFSVTVTKGYEGLITNTATIDCPQIAEPVTVTAEATITDHPIFAISKSATPALPGAEKPLTYELLVTNLGQPAVMEPITVTDFVPADTTYLAVGPDGVVSPEQDIITWTRSVTLDMGETTAFTFSVNVGNVTSGTVLHNGIYFLHNSFETAPVVGEPLTTTVVDPVLLIFKSIDPDPPGSNHEMTYTLTVLNLGSKATGVEIYDVVPAGVD